MVRFPPSVGFAALCNCLRVLSSRLSSISVTFFRRLLYVLLNLLRSYRPRKPPCPMQHLSKPVGGFPSAHSPESPGIAASTLPTTPMNASGKSTCQQPTCWYHCMTHITFEAVRSTGHSSSASITGSFVPALGIIDLQHPPRDMIPFVASAVQRYGKNVRMQVTFGALSAEMDCWSYA